MKTLILLISLTLIVSVSKAQEKFIGDDKQNILYVFGEGNIVQKGLTEDQSTSFVAFKISETSNICFYFNGNLKCIEIVNLITQNDQLIYAIQDLNKRFIHLDGSTWTSSDYTIKVELKKYSNGFSIIYSHI